MLSLARPPALLDGGRSGKWERKKDDNNHGANSVRPIDCVCTPRCWVSAVGRVFFHAGPRSAFCHSCDDSGIGVRALGHESNHGTIPSPSEIMAKIIDSGRKFSIG